MPSDPIEHDIENELEIANHIVLRRINDVLISILFKLDPEQADNLTRLHEKGIFITPPPAWMPGADLEE